MMKNTSSKGKKMLDNSVRLIYIHKSDARASEKNKKLGEHVAEI